MERTLLQYKDFIWPNNPETLEIEAAGEVRELCLPLSRFTLQELGTRPRRVTGSGSFMGEGADAAFAALERLLDAGGAGPLFLPGAAPLEAVLQTLTRREEPGPGRISYAFAFLELPRAPGGTDCRRAETIRAGETLYHLAERTGVDVETLLRRNPAHSDPFDVREGDAIWLG